MTAIYARQSADRKDSISIETQIIRCKSMILDDEKYEVFSDRGFSGSNTNRPAFSTMIEQTRLGKFSRIITYKLDRISRSLLDFVLMLEDFKNLDVEFISCTESFSSKSEMGVLIMKLLVMFAEMERKNIRMRVVDNYYSRGEKGFYLGGYPPFGYKKVAAFIEGKKTSGYEINNNESVIVKSIYTRLAGGMASANAICKELNLRGTYTRKEKPWSPTTLIRLVRNPFYVCSDWKIYDYLLKSGARITSDSSKFSGKNGCICYGSKSSRTAEKFKSFTGETITLGRHLGIISSDLWLKAQSAITKNQRSFQGSVKSYLTGVVTCAHCNSKYSISSSKGINYLYCRKRKLSGCSTLVKTIRSDFISLFSDEVIHKELYGLAKCNIPIQESQEVNQLRIKVSEIERNLLKLKEKLKTTAVNSIEFFDNAVCELEQEKTLLYECLEKEVADSKRLCYTNFNNVIDRWGSIDNQYKRLIAKELIDEIQVSSGILVILLI